MGRCNGLVQIGRMRDEDGIGCRVVEGGLNVIAHSPLDRDIRDETMHVLGIDARAVAGIGVAVGVSVLAVEEVKELVAVLDGGHIQSP
jgi:hypothetical protein